MSLPKSFKRAQESREAHIDTELREGTGRLLTALAKAARAAYSAREGTAGRKGSRGEEAPTELWVHIPVDLWQAVLNEADRLSKGSGQA